MSRLWDKGERFDEVVERFTVGRDPELDVRLVAFDALGSAAHVRMLARVGLLDVEEERTLNEELREIALDARSGRFAIDRSQEDCHTAIEDRLTERLGDAGRRVHTGRSRNDQVIAALRLFGREATLTLTSMVVDLGGELCDLAEAHRQVSIPGYTHTRQAMPSTVGLLFGAFAEALVDDVPWLQTAFAHQNRSPLGSASGFGVPLPLDRPLVASLLRFDVVQANVIAVQNDRGKAEHLTLTACAQPALDLARLAADLIWYSSDELGFICLGREVTTGSSIMPQKRNPDALELVRGSGARLRGRISEIASLCGTLSSGYHRDLQLTKEPFLEGMQIAQDVVAVMTRVLQTLEVRPAACLRAFRRSIGATDAMCQRIAGGQPMRLAYCEVAIDPAGAYVGDVAEAWKARVHLGAPVALDLTATRRALSEARRWVEARRSLVAEAWRELLGL